MNSCRFGMVEIGQTATLKNSSIEWRHVCRHGVGRVGLHRQPVGYYCRTCFPGSNALSWVVAGLIPAPEWLSGRSGFETLGDVAERFLASSTQFRGRPRFGIWRGDVGDGTVEIGRKFPVEWCCRCRRIVQRLLTNALKVRWSRIKSRSIFYWRRITRYFKSDFKNKNRYV